eukprot:g43266.t1
MNVVCQTLPFRFANELEGRKRRLHSSETCLTTHQGLVDGVCCAGGGSGSPPRPGYSTTSHHDRWRIPAACFPRRLLHCTALHSADAKRTPFSSGVLCSSSFHAHFFSYPPLSFLLVFATTPSWRAIHAPSKACVRRSPCLDLACVISLNRFEDAGVVQFAGQGQKQNKATKKPDARAVSERAAAGPPGPLQWLTPLTAAKQPSAFFLYQRGQDVLRDSSISKGLLSEEAGYVYGARLPTGGRSTALGPELALVTSDPAHVLPGQLLHWGNEVFPDRLAAIDRLNGYNEFLPDHDRLRRGIVTVWRSDGSSCLAFWHYQVAPVHKYTPLTPYPTTFAPLSSPAQAGPPSFIFDTVGPPLTSPVETVQVSGEEPTECVVEPGVAAVRPRLRDRAIVGFTRRKRSDPDFVYKLMVETALSQSIALFTNLSVRGWNPTDWGASGVAQYLIQVVLELMNNVILVWALTPVAPLTEEEKLLVPLLASDLERENNPNRIEHFFQRNAACTYKDRFKVVFEKAKFYGTVGLGTGFVGGLLFTLFQRSDLTSPETWAFVLRLTLANTVMLSTSSTP